MRKKIVILGGGPTGLGAAWRLWELGHPDFHLYEKESRLGGLAGSFTDPAGFTWDIGGHVSFSHYAYYDRVFDDLMGRDFQMNDRESWVRVAGRWVPYPFQNNLRHLPGEETFECLVGLIEAQYRRSSAAAENFQEFIDGVFGDGIARLFMNPYNFKVWAHPPKMLGGGWVGERVAAVDVHRALRNVVLGIDDFGWGPNSRFKYPLFGGTGEFYRRFAGPLAGRFTLGKAAERVDLDRKEVWFSDGEVVGYDHLVTTLPLDVFCNAVAQGVPSEIKRAAARLRHSGGHMVGVGIRQPPPSTKSWMYFPEEDCPFYRVTYLSNYSPYMTPDAAAYHSLLCETSYGEFKPADASRIVAETLDGLVNVGLLPDVDRGRVVSTWHMDVPYSYPTPTVERDRILAQVIPWLERREVYSRGRFGLWKYEVSNTDHSLMQGVELVNRLVLNEAETTTGTTYHAE